VSLSTLELAALRRLARAYRRILVLAVPAALASCQDGGDALAPETSDAGGVVAVPAAAAGLAAPNQNRILYAAQVAEEEYDLYGMGPGGGNVTHLTTFAGAEMNPAWSPDHKQVAFERWRNNRRDIYLMNADGSNKHWALPTQSSYILGGPSWSPDGTNLLVVVQTSSTGTTYVAKIDLASGKLLILAPAGYYNRPGRHPVYSKDGGWIYYITGGPPTTPGTSSSFEMRVFKPYGPDYRVCMLVWDAGDLSLSPDGTKMAYDMRYGGTTQRDIWLFDLKTGKGQRLTSTSTNEIMPAWSPDGSQIAFTGDKAGGWQIYTMSSSTGGNVQKLTNVAMGAASPAWYR
jgi:TolB protein